MHPALELEPGAVAYESLAGERAALQPHQLLPINVDVSLAASRVLSAAPQIRDLVPQMQRELPHFPHQRALRLEAYALAAWYAHAGAYHVKRLSITKPLIAKARPLRRKLVKAARLFADVDILDANKVASIRVSNGRIDMAKDMIALATMMKEAWPKIAATPIVTPADLEMASVLGNELLRALAHGERELELRRAAVKDDSVRAFTLLVRTYDDAQRAVGYLRWPHGDAHRIAPSLFDNGGGRPRLSKANIPAHPPGAAEQEPTDAGDVLAAQSSS